MLLLRNVAVYVFLVSVINEAVVVVAWQTPSGVVVLGLIAVVVILLAPAENRRLFSP